MFFGPLWHFKSLDLFGKVVDFEDQFRIVCVKCFRQLLGWGNVSILSDGQDEDILSNDISMNKGEMADEETQEMITKLQQDYSTAISDNQTLQNRNISLQK